MAGASEHVSPRAVIEGRGLSKRFGGVLALDRVDASIRAGEVLAVVG